MGELYTLAVEGGGIWCVICVWFIKLMMKKLDKVETWVRDTVTELIKDNTAALKSNTEIMRAVQEKLDADKNQR